MKGKKDRGIPIELDIRTHQMINAICCHEGVLVKKYMVEQLIEEKYNAIKEGKDENI